MLYVFHGSDIAQAAGKAHALLDSLQLKRPDAALIRIESDAWSARLIGEHVASQGLFSKKYIVFLDRVTENADAKEELADYIEAMSESENIFIVLEGKLNVALTRAVEKYAERVVLCDKKEGVGSMKSGGDKPESNIFALADAFGNRDAFRAWRLFREAIDNGAEPESLVGMLCWKAKSKPDLARIYRELICLYHDAHRGLSSMEISVERLLLSLSKP